MTESPIAVTTCPSGRGGGVGEGAGVADVLGVGEASDELTVAVIGVAAWAGAGLAAKALREAAAVTVRCLACAGWPASWYTA